MSSQASRSSLSTSTDSPEVPAAAWKTISSSVFDRLSNDLYLPLFAPLDGFEDMHRDVSHLNRVVLEPFALHAIVDHDVAERARRRDARGACRDELLRAL